jgi:hypothetical protein
VPQRSNSFQKLVKTIKEHLSDNDAHVRESALLNDLITGKPREVDVCITRVVAGETVCISIECRDSARPAAVGWVEEMFAKHQALPTHYLLLASRNGFTKQAKLKAEALNIGTAHLGELSGETARSIVGVINRIGVRGFRLSCFTTEIRTSADQAWVVLAPDDWFGHIDPDEGIAVLLMTADLARVALDDRALLSEFLRDLVHEPIQNGSFTVEANLPPPAYLLPPDPSSDVKATLARSQEVDRVRVSGSLQFEDSKLSLAAGSLIGADAMWGESSLVGEDVLTVVTEVEGICRTSVVRAAPADPNKPELILRFNQFNGSDEVGARQGER